MLTDQNLGSLTSAVAEFCERFYAWEAGVAKLGRLSVPQMRTVCIIGRNKEIRMKDIAERMELTTGTVTVMVDRLQVMGFVERSRNEQDRRSYKIVLSEKGMAYYAEHLKRQRELIAKLTSKLSDVERKAFEKTLKDFTAAI